MSEVKNEMGQTMPPIENNSAKVKSKIKAEAMSPFVRKLILQNLDDSNEDILKKCEDFEFVNGLKPSLSTLYNARMQIKIKYDIQNFEDIPRNNNGKINVSAMAKLLIKKNPSLDDKQIRDMLKADGINIAYSLDRLRPSKKIETNKPADLVAKKILVKLTETKEIETKEIKEAKKKPLIEYDVIEEQLDILINQAREVVDSELVKKLKEARRYIIIKSAKESTKESVK